MATAVLDLDLDSLPPEITGLDRYVKALILIRFKGKPIGKTEIPVTDGRISIEDNYFHLLDAVKYTWWTKWLHDYLDWDERNVTNLPPPTATVAVCTRNRTDDLKRCLDALMRLPDDGQEYLVIDNCPSNDDTQKLVETYGRVRYIRENRPGLNIARNRALLEARHEIVAFTDDDATPDPGWLRAILRNFFSPLVISVTGLTMPLELETEAQEAFENYSSFSKGFNRKIFSSSTHNPLATGQVGAGANMAFRRSVQQEVGLFDEALDAGTLTQSGGDHEYFARILMAGYHIIYEPEALCWHRHRRTWEETRKAINGYGVGVYAFWTRLLVVEREFGILKFPIGWFRHIQLPNLVKAILRRPGSQPLDLILAELRGCLVGPWAYMSARRRLKNKNMRA